MTQKLAPALQAARWLNAAEPLSLERLRGRVVLIDRQGRRRAQYFGHIPDLRLGAEIMALIAEHEDTTAIPETTADPSAPACDEAGCVAPTAQGDRPV